MRRLRFKPIDESDKPLDPMVQYPEDIARLVNAARSEGYELAPADAAKMWLAYSSGLCANWLSPTANDKALVEEMLRYATEEQSVSSGPRGVKRHSRGFASVTITLTPQDYRRLRLSARKQGMSVEAYVQAATRDCLPKSPRIYANPPPSLVNELLSEIDAVATRVGDVVDEVTAALAESEARMRDADAKGKP